MIDVEIITPEKVLLKETDNIKVNLPLTSGDYEVREHHAPYMANVASGMIVIEKEEGVSNIKLAVHGGFVQIAENKITMVAKSAEIKSGIDFVRAQDSKKRATDRIVSAKNNSSKEPIDLDRARRSLIRANTRLKLKD